MTLPSVNIIALVFGLSELGLSLFKRSGRRDSKSDAGSLGVIWIVILLSIALAWVLRSMVPSAAMPAAESVYGVGFAVFVIGAVLRWYSIYYLGRFFTVDVQVGSDHRVIDTGPYRWIRHPSYTGVLLEFLGFAMCLGNRLSLAAMMIPVVGAFLYRIRVEERALSGALGASYDAYRQRTRKLIPFLY